MVELRRLTAALCSVTLVVGCAEREGRPVAPCAFTSVVWAAHPDGPTQVDLLFVVDDSGSMRDMSARLATELPELVGILLSGDFDGDGAVDFAPVDDLHVGVVSTDMGTWGVPTPTCADAERGGDGLMTAGSCASTAPAFLRFAPNRGAADASLEDVACRVALGEDGCGFEQPLEAALKALSPRAPTDWTAADYTPPAFFVGGGHGDGENAGFSRPSAVLAIVPVTDEDDCSVRSPDVFDVRSRTGGTTDEDLSCFVEGMEEALHPAERYALGLLGLRRRPTFVVFSPIVGVPRDLQGVDPETGVPRFVDWDRLVGAIGEERDPRMIPTLEDGVIAASCTSSDGASATPPVRIAEVARQLEARGSVTSVTSICDDDWRGALYPILLQTGGGAFACAPPSIDLRECGIRLTAVEGSVCDDIAGASEVLEPPFEAQGRAVCELAQLEPTDADREASEPPAGDGWYIDDYTAWGERWCGSGDEPFQRLAATVNVPPGTEVRLVCHRIVADSGVETSR